MSLAQRAKKVLHCVQTQNNPEWLRPLRKFTRGSRISAIKDQFPIPRGTGEAPSNMVGLLENIANSLSLAFGALEKGNDKVVSKSKLKVLTANIGTMLDLYGVEKGLDHFKESQYLDFIQFKQYLRQEVFASLPQNISLGELRNCEGRIAEMCWLVCRKKYVVPERKFDDDSVYKLYRIFCLLAELSLDDQNRSHVLLPPAEAEMIAQKLATSLGNPWDEDDFTSLSVSMGSFPLGPLLNVLETRCLAHVTEKQAIVEAVHELYQTFIEDVIKKGTLSKRGYIFHTMREYWFVLRPCELTYYKTANEKEKSGTIVLQPGNRIETRSDFKFILHTPERNFELAAKDHMTQLQWHTALQNAIEYSGGKQSYQRLQALKRRKQRQGRAQEVLRAKQQLQLEKSARQLAEGKAKELKDEVREETRKLMEMEIIKDRLEKLLEEETQAKRDEEIVRGLQARLLQEEWDKRAELEALQEEQIGLLEEESRKRQKYEQLQRQKETQLQDAHTKLATLQNERKQLDEQLKAALMKTRVSEDRKEHLEMLLLEIGSGEVLPRSKDRNKIRRAHSFMPSTKDRPLISAVHTLKKS